MVLFKIKTVSFWPLVFSTNELKKKKKNIFSNWFILLN
jgi:hypothetical protein